MIIYPASDGSKMTVALPDSGILPMVVSNGSDKTNVNLVFKGKTYSADSDEQCEALFAAIDPDLGKIVAVLEGVVQDANITSANSTAQTIYECASVFFTKAANDLKASYKCSDNENILTFTVKNGKWTLANALSESKFGDGKTVVWSGSNDIQKCFTAFAADYIPGISDGVVQIYIDRRVVSGAAYAAGSNLPANFIPFTTSDWSRGSYFWYDKAGVYNGVVIGTIPTLK